MEAHDIAAAIGAEVIGRFENGEGTGAYAVRTTDGLDAVLKLFEDDVLDLGARAELTAALRARGYPAPTIYASGVHDGIRYEIQERMPGVEMGQPTSERVATLRDLVVVQREVGRPGRGPWVETMVASVTEGCVGYCQHDAMTEHSDETRALLERLRRIAAAARNIDVSDRDVVHYDFSPHNVLVDGDRITGVVDWGGATNGDAAFDLVTIAAFTYDYAVRDALLAAAAHLTDPRALALYAAHMVLRQIDWSLRNRNDFEVAWFMDTGTALLAAVGAG